MAIRWSCEQRLGHRPRAALSEHRFGAARFDAIAINPAAVSEHELQAYGTPIVILGLR